METIKTKKIYTLFIALFIPLFFAACSPANQVKRQIDKFTGSPEVQTITPEDGQKNVALDTKISITFSEEMNQDTLNGKGIIVSYANEDLVVFLNPFLNSKYEYNEAEKKVTITPSQNFIPDQEVKIILTDAVENKSGKKLPVGGNKENERYVYTFKTAKTVGDASNAVTEEEQANDTIAAQEEVEDSETKFNAAIARNEAISFIETKSETFKYDGQRDTLAINKVNKIGCDGCFEITVSFLSENQGYGDRSEQGIASGETLHEVIVDFEGGKVVQAVMDEKWDVLTQQMVR